MFIRLEFITAVLGSRASNNATTQQSVRREPTASNVRKGTAMDHYRKISAEMQSAETDILSRLRREAAERAHDFEELTSGFYITPCALQE